MWYISLIRDGQPKFQVLYLILEALLVNLNASFKANGVYLFLSVFIEAVEAQIFIFLSDPREVHVDLSCKNSSSNKTDSWSIQRNLNFKDSQKVIDNIEACNRFKCHKMTYSR